VFKKLDDLQQHDLDINEIMGILKELQDSHRAFHVEEERSKTAFIKKINNEVMVGPGAQPNTHRYMAGYDSVKSRGNDG
jgi:hypothetical protein